MLSRSGGVTNLYRPLTPSPYSSHSLPSPYHSISIFLVNIKVLLLLLLLLSFNINIVLSFTPYYTTYYVTTLHPRPFSTTSITSSTSTKLMGLLKVGKPKSWADSKHNLQYVRDAGVRQFVSTYRVSELCRTCNRE